ncbi:membrane protein [Agaricicola taiwanensis]|uniref:Membrane protein n=2 Tax=Agaricicola taiwanensis TaxID=591372 RepID=A0A8J2YGF7_9RHOB|nr:membrane protein [Agaricicola taiwanensis]
MLRETTMRWGDLRRSSNVEDRRGMRMPGGRGGGLGIGTILVLGIVGYALGIDPRILIGGAEMLQGGGSGYEQQAPGREGAPDDETGQFISAVLGSSEDIWGQIFSESGGEYREPRLVVFSGATQSACGLGQSAMGPFYCPGDQRIYLDTSFFQELAQRFRAPGEFANAYVIAHEIGHHVQNLIGILPRVNAQRQSLPQAQANALSVRVELQADCFAGVWAHHAEQRFKILEEGDVEAALNAASAIGDDKLQRQSQGMVVPDSFTHGSSAQRVQWFRTGLQSGSLRSCDTFSANPS